MSRVLVILISCMHLIAACSSENNIRLESPSKNLKVIIDTSEKGLSLSLFDNQTQMLTARLGGLIFENDSWKGNQISDLKKSSKDEDWDPVYGERSTIQNSYNEVIFTLSDAANPNQKLQLLYRLFDEGIAFRYIFDRQSGWDHILTQEETSFSFDDDYKVWVADRAQSAYRELKISEIENACERPLLIKRNDNSFLALGEAALVDYARMKFIRDQDNSFSVKVKLSGTVDLKKAKYQSPWRYIMVGESPGELLENNYFIENLNEPNQLEDISWIKPGKIIREVTLTTIGGMACIDFAVRHNLQYVELDAGWYGNEYDDQSDASTITVDPRRSPGPLDLHKIIDYANSKGIGIILYVNRRALEKQLDEVLPLLQSWGVKGVKYGFVNVGPQEWTSWLHEAIRKAAKYKLMVDVHDEYRPTGYSRTYPNLMTQEGIRGDEESPSVEHTLITLFTRMLAGAGDNTNCYLAPRVQEKMGGKTAQMAKAVMLYSPWQFLYWYDRPEGSPHKKGGAGAATGVLFEDEDLSFYDALPTTWDETIVLEGEIGKYATIARRNGDNWFIGSLTSHQSKEINIPFEFLNENDQYEAKLYYQNAEDLKNNEVSRETIRVNSLTVFSRELPGNSGLALVIRKNRKRISNKKSLILFLHRFISMNSSKKFHFKQYYGLNSINFCRV